MVNELEKDILKVLVTEEELKNRVQAMGAELAERFVAAAQRYRKNEG